MKLNSLSFILLLSVANCQTQEYQQYEDPNFDFMLSLKQFQEFDAEEREKVKTYEYRWESIGTSLIGTKLKLKYKLLSDLINLIRAYTSIYSYSINFRHIRECSVDLNKIELCLCIISPAL